MSVYLRSALDDPFTSGRWWREHAFVERTGVDADAIRAEVEAGRLPGHLRAGVAWVDAHALLQRFPQVDLPAYPHALVRRGRWALGGLGLASMALLIFGAWQESSQALRWGIAVLFLTFGLANLLFSRNRGFWGETDMGLGWMGLIARKVVEWESNYDDAIVFAALRWRDSYRLSQRP